MQGQQGRHDGDDERGQRGVGAGDDIAADRLRRLEPLDLGVQEGAPLVDPPERPQLEQPLDPKIAEAADKLWGWKPGEKKKNKHH